MVCVFLHCSLIILEMNNDPCTQAEAVVNAGPANFISANGPNPLMVQVLL